MGASLLETIHTDPIQAQGNQAMQQVRAKTLGWPYLHKSNF